MCYYNSRQLDLLQITTPGVLLQFTIARLSEFSTTVTKIYDRRYNLRRLLLQFLRPVLQFTTSRQFTTEHTSLTCDPF